MPKQEMLEAVEAIKALAAEIRGDWSDPREECREIWEWCNKLKAALEESPDA